MSDATATRAPVEPALPDRAAVGRAIDRALEFLARRQLPSGQFPVEQTLRDGETGASLTQPDDTPFATAHIVHSLGWAVHPSATTMIARALAYFRSEQHGPGLWRHWNKASSRHALIPLDADDTACISHLLARHGQAPDNTHVFLLNRDRCGLFYTWLIPRARLGGGWRYWRLMLGDLNAARAFGFWKRTAARRGDVDGVVNANVLVYLGDRPETRPVVDYLLRIVDDEGEAACDKWYHEPSVFWHAVSRAYAAGVVRLGARRSVIVRRIGERDSSTRGAELGLALDACTLLNLGEHGPALDATIGHLVQAQHEDGGWASYPFYYGGRRDVAAWGSRELTTGFCVEALSRYGALRAPSA